MKISDIIKYDGESCIEVELDGNPRNHNTFIIPEDSYLFDKLAIAISQIKYEIDRIANKTNKILYTEIIFVNNEVFKIVNNYSNAKEVIIEGSYSSKNESLWIKAGFQFFVYDMDKYNRDKKFFSDSKDNLSSIGHISNDVRWNEFPKGTDPAFIKILKEMLSKFIKD